jgi:6-pyruvoyltetrahydropterin/6-carboxytetrahydropterin synthase
MTSITKIFYFEAAHRLPLHKGKCQNTHGHGYKIEVTIEGEPKTIGSSTGMVMDFGDLTKIVNREVIEKLDHKMINDIIVVPTAEEIAEWIFVRVEEGLKMGGESCKVKRIRVWETNNCFVDYKKTPVIAAQDGGQGL